MVETKTLMQNSWSLHCMTVGIHDITCHKNNYGKGFCEALMTAVDGERLRSRAYLMLNREADRDKLAMVK